MKKDINVRELLETINSKVKKSGSVKDRWSLGDNHHPLSELLIRAMADIGWEKFGNYDIRCGGDGDEGESMMFILDSYFQDFDGIKDVKHIIEKLED